MARSSSPRPYDNDCLRLPATSSPRKRGAKKKESTGLRLNRLCPPYVTPSSISSFGRRPSSAHIAESKSLKNSGENTFCQSSARTSLPFKNTLLETDARVLEAAYQTRFEQTVVNEQEQQAKTEPSAGTDEGQQLIQVSGDRKSASPQITKRENL